MPLTSKNKAARVEAAVNRRREPRFPAAGEVQLVAEELPGVEICARLLDVSQGGFRATHDCLFLCSGQQVSFRDRCRQGKARLIWTRVVGKCVESGFLILETW